MYQKIITFGNLGNDPEMRYMPDGTAVTSFSVATNRRWTSANGQPGEETTWFRVSVWRRQAETVNQYLSKGSKVLVEGRLKPDGNTGGPRLWTRQDGTTAASFEITAENVQFLSSRGETDDSYSPSDNADYSSGSSAVEEDDIPF